MQLEKYERRARNSVSERTLTTRMSSLRSLEEFIGGGEPTPKDVEDWIDHLIARMEDGDISSGTIREYFKHCRYYFETVKGEQDALEHIERWLPTQKSDAGEHLTYEEFEAIMEKLTSYRDKALYKVMYHYSRRPMEVVLLNEEDVDFENGVITFCILKKHDKDLPQLTLDADKDEEKQETYRIMPATFELDDEVREPLKKYLKYRLEREQVIELDGESDTVHPLFTTKHGRISYDTVYNKIKNAAAAAGIEKNVFPKTMRHSRATHLDWEGHAPGNIARDMLIHGADTSVIHRYIHDRDEGQVRSVMGSDE